MDTRAAPISQRPEQRAERWYVNVQGRTLGPFESEEVKRGLARGEFDGNDKISPSRQPKWQTIAEHSLFGGLASSDEAPRSAFLVPPPPPALLRAKPVAAPPLPNLPPEVPARPAEPVMEVAPVIPVPTEEKKEAKEVATEQQEELSDPETDAALEAATLELDRALKTIQRREKEAALRKEADREKERLAPKAQTAAPTAAPLPEGIPARPSYEPVFFAPETQPARASAKAEKRVIQIELKLPEKPLHWAILGALALGTALYAGRDSLPFLDSGNKMRDLKDFRLSDPSSPTDIPLTADDPIPPLKAPTRPQRE